MHNGETINELMRMNGVEPPPCVAELSEITEVPLDLEQRMKDLEDAYKLLDQIKTSVALGPMAPYSVVLHAQNEVDRQYTELFNKRIGRQG